jgi:hypothetical protein
MPFNRNNRREKVHGTACTAATNNIFYQQTKPNARPLVLYKQKPANKLL